ncbi:MAG: carbon-nitrogen hydrolase [Bdellovibrionales bacterium]|nr:carbon-nitrogen hydrolase [Bdellovibrionales bacterium]
MCAKQIKTPKRFKVALLQTVPGPDAEENLLRACSRVEDAAQQGAKLICLPELFLSPYFCQVEDDKLFDLAEAVPGHSTEVLAKLAAKTGTVIVASLFERRTAGLYHNTAAILDANGEIAGLYRKMHIPDDPSYYEKFYFTPGDLGFKVFDTAVGKIGTLVCWDQWFPEAARLSALAGAQVLLYPTAIGWHPREKEAFGKAQHEAWRTSQRAHAIANGVYVASINRAGLEKPNPDIDGIEFWGQSFFCDPQGVVLAEAPPSGETTLYGEVDLEHLETIRRNWPFLRDRRIDAYGGLTRRYLDAPEGIR